MNLNDNLIICLIGIKKTLLIPHFAIVCLRFLVVMIFGCTSVYFPVNASILTSSFYDVDYLIHKKA